MDDDTKLLQCRLVRFFVEYFNFVLSEDNINILKLHNDLTVLILYEDFKVC